MDLKSITKIIVLTFILAMLGRSSSGAPKSYSYSCFTYNDTQLHCIKTLPDNIRLLSLKQEETLDQSGFCGINGGYFPIGMGDKAYSIAVQKNGGVLTPVIDSAAGAGYSDGRSNLSDNGRISPRGTLVWSGAAFSCQKAYYYAELTGVEWAQGGVSMALGDADWHSQAADREALPIPDAAVMRTAMIGVNGETPSVYLIVSGNGCTAEAFRTAIENMLHITDCIGGADSAYVGIFLDGGPSSQLKALTNTGETVSVATDTKLVQIVALKDG